MRKQRKVISGPRIAINVAIVGRPNVGKSTLFNRFIKKRRAIESSVAGTTRDRISDMVKVDEFDITITDTGGIQFDNMPLEEDVRAQANFAINTSDIVVFVVSALEELTVNDFAIAQILRKAGKPSVLVVNKCDNEKYANGAYNMYELGFGHPVLVSAAHSRGIEALSGVITQKARDLNLSNDAGSSDESLGIKLAIIGRPNVGKSSFFNALIGEDRAIVSDISGTTRDELDTAVTYKGRNYVFKDTAGIRRRGKRTHGIEGLSVIRSLKALNEADIAVILFDYGEGITKQDMHVASEAMDSGKGVILVVNKADLMEKGQEARDKFIFDLQRKCAFLSFAPVLFVSSKTGKNVEKIFDLADAIQKARSLKIPTPEINSFISSLVATYKPHGTKSTLPKIYYVAQIGICPPHFAFFTNNPDAIHFSYKRFLENRLREQYGFNGTPLVMDFRGRDK